MEFHEYLSQWTRSLSNFPQWRAGQAAFNILHQHRPDLANMVRNTGLDPFYDDDKLPGFLVWISERW